MSAALTAQQVQGSHRIPTTAAGAKPLAACTQQHQVEAVGSMLIAPASVTTTAEGVDLSFVNCRVQHNSWCGTNVSHVQPRCVSTTTCGYFWCVAGGQVVVAESYARIFFRNCMSTGELYPVETDVRLCEELNTGGPLAAQAA